MPLAVRRFYNNELFGAEHPNERLVSPKENTLDCKNCINANPDLMKLRKLESASAQFGIAIELVQAGAELGKDPKELVATFKRAYDAAQPILGSYWNLSLHEMFVVLLAKRVVQRAKEQMSFSSSDLDKAILELWTTVDELEKREKEVLG